MTKFTKFLVGAVVAVAVFASSASASYTHTGVLKMGMTSSQVQSLQKTLNGGGFLISTTGAGSPGMESMYFGAKTKAAVMSFQVAKGLMADGVVGAQTGTALAAMTDGSVTTPGATLPAGCVAGAMFSATTGQPCSTTTTTTGALKGSVGSVDYELVSSISNEEVGEDSSDVKIAGLEIDAEDSDSDVQITSVKLVFAQGTATNDDFDEFADDVSVWLGSTKVGSVDASEFNDDNDYEKTISLSNAIVRMDDSEDLVVAVSGVNNLDSGDEGDTWTVDFRQVRFVDAQGATTTEDPTTSPRSFSFETFSTANDVELVVDLNDDEDDINEAHVVDIDDTNDTDNVSILAFTLEADGDSDIVVDEIPVTLTVTGAANVDEIVESIDLYHGSTKVASETVPATSGASEVIVFEKLDITIDAEDIKEFTVKANILSLDEFDEGDTLKAEITTPANVNAIEAEDESGDELDTVANGERSGSAPGEAISFYDNGITAKFVSATETKTFTADEVGESDVGQFKLTFSVTSFGDSDLRIDRSCEEAGVDAAGQGVEFSITNSGSNATNCLLSASDTDSEDTVNTFELDRNTTRTFTLTVNATASAAHFAEVALASINWGTATDDTNANYYSFNLEDFKTDPMYLNDL